MKSTIYFAGAAVAVLALGLVPFAPHSEASGLGMAALAAQAQDSVSFRVVSGSVMNDSDSTVSGATVFLKDLKSKSIRSFTSTSDGSFQFAGCNMAIDYELWAEKGDKKSAVKTVSTWDTRKQYVANLRLK